MPVDHKWPVLGVRQELLSLTERYRSLYENNS